MRQHPSSTDVQFTLRTDRGLVRKTNEDAMGSAVDTGGSRLFCIADGMGGHAAGDVASKLAVDAALTEWCDTSHADVLWRLARCVDEANTAVLNEAARRSMDYGDMGTTIVLLAIAGGAAYWAHVGDSRAYLLTQGELLCLTKDHTEAQELADTGQIDQASVETHESSHILTRGLGLEPTAVADLSGPRPMQADDTVLLCTDGLTNTTPDKLIRDVLSYYDLESACTAMLAHARFRGGPDNTTLAVARVGPRVGPLAIAPDGFEMPADRFRRQARLALLMVAIAAAIAIGLWLVL